MPTRSGSLTSSRPRRIRHPPPAADVPNAASDQPLAKKVAPAVVSSGDRHVGRRQVITLRPHAGPRFSQREFPNRFGWTLRRAPRNFPFGVRGTINNGKPMRHLERRPIG